MRRKAYLSVEAMESRALLSGLSYSVTTDRPVYQAGQPIELASTVTNTGDEPDMFFYPPIAGFEITQDGQTVWQSDPMVPNEVLNDYLQPGQSLTIQSTWDGTISNGTSVTTASGVFTVTDVLDYTGASSVTFQIQSPLSYTLTAPPAITPFGQSVPFSYTITNTSDQPDTFNLDLPDFIVTWTDSDAVWESDPGAASQAPTSQTLQPGQSLTETGSWDAVANEGNYAGTDVWGGYRYVAIGLGGANVWQGFSVSLLGAPAGLNEEFAIGSPLTLTLTTDQTTYQPGQSVNMTATETNTSDQPITIMNTQDQFDVASYGGTVMTEGAVSSGGPVVTLQPGQSQTFEATWDPGPLRGWPWNPGSESFPNEPETWWFMFDIFFQEAVSPGFNIELSPPPITYSPLAVPFTPPPAEFIPDPVITIPPPAVPFTPGGPDGSNPNPLPVPSPSPIPTSTVPTPTTGRGALPIAASHPPVMSPSPFPTTTATTQAIGQQALPIAATLAESTPPGRRGDAVRVQPTLGNDSGKGVLLGASSWAGEIRLRGGTTLKPGRGFHATGGAV